MYDSLSIQMVCSLSVAAGIIIAAVLFLVYPRKDD